MKTTATNRKIRVLITAIREKKLIPKPEFQRRLVWTNKHKRAFLATVLKGYPFPEIFIAAGEVNPETAEGVEMLVDGQQRLTTLHQYFVGSDDLDLKGEVLSYEKLSVDEKTKFLEYEVVVRDLGSLSLAEIKEVFLRINSTTYSLNAMEVHNARFDGEFKQFAERISQYDFFEKHRVFSAMEARRMQDVKFILSVLVTCMSAYFNRDDDLEEYLAKYNDEFDGQDELDKQFQIVLDFIEKCDFPPDARVWKKSDLYTLLVELYRWLILRSEPLNPQKVSKALTQFYLEVDNVEPEKQADLPVAEYHAASVAATNDRGSRIKRGEIISKLLEGTVKNTRKAKHV